MLTIQYFRKYVCVEFCEADTFSIARHYYPDSSPILLLLELHRRCNSEAQDKNNSHVSLYRYYLSGDTLLFNRPLPRHHYLIPPFVSNLGIRDCRIWIIDIIMNYRIRIMRELFFKNRPWHPKSKRFRLV